METPSDLPPPPAAAIKNQEDNPIFRDKSHFFPIRIFISRKYWLAGGFGIAIPAISAGIFTAAAIILCKNAYYGQNLLPFYGCRMQPGMQDTPPSDGSCRPDFSIPERWSLFGYVTIGPSCFRGLSRTCTSHHPSQNTGSRLPLRPAQNSRRIPPQKPPSRMHRPDGRYSGGRHIQSSRW